MNVQKGSREVNVRKEWKMSVVQIHAKMLDVVNKEDMEDSNVNAKMDTMEEDAKKEWMYAIQIHAKMVDVAKKRDPRTTNANAEMASSERNVKEE